jgi:hypothetical protein
MTNRFIFIPDDMVDPNFTNAGPIAALRSLSNEATKSAYTFAASSDSFCRVDIPVSIVHRRLLNSEILVPSSFAPIPPYAVETGSFCVHPN